MSTKHRDSSDSRGPRHDKIRLASAPDVMCFQGNHTLPLGITDLSRSLEMKIAWEFVGHLVSAGDEWESP